MSLMSNMNGRITKDVDELLEVIKTLKVKINTIKLWLHSKFDIIPEDIKDVLLSCDDLCSIRFLSSNQPCHEDNSNELENVVSAPISDFGPCSPFESDENNVENTISNAAPVKEEPAEVEVKDEYVENNIDLVHQGGIGPSYSTNTENNINSDIKSEFSDNRDVKTASHGLNKLILKKKVVILLHDINKTKSPSQVRVKSVRRSFARQKSSESNSNSAVNSYSRSTTKVCRKSFPLTSERDGELCKEKTSKRRSRYIKRKRIIKNLSCELCQRNYDVQKDLEDHMEVHKVNVFICAHNRCERRCTTQEEIVEHQSKIHCQSCARNFPHLAHFTVHNDKTHSGQASISVLEHLLKNESSGNSSKMKIYEGIEYQCSKCAGLFKTLFGFKLHLGSGCYECKICGKICQTPGILKIHLKNSHNEGEKSFLCTICGKTFRQSGNLATHTRTQHAEERRIFKCSSCDKTFISFDGYSTHMKTHGEIQRELCTMCGFDFATRRILNKHINAVHKNIRAHPCRLCDKRFKRAYALTRHYKTHENPNMGKRGLNKDKDYIEAAAKLRNINK